MQGCELRVAREVIRKSFLLLISRLTDFREQGDWHQDPPP